MRIVELPREQYAGYSLVFEYDTSFFYDLRMRTTENVFSTEFVRTPCERMHKSFSDTLFAEYWDDPHAYGLWDGQELLAVIEINHEKWNNRMRVTNLCVRQGFRRRGAGTLLMTRAKEIARAQGCRAMILETQSCNSGAIAFYLRQGYTFVGFDATCYGNRDIDNREVRIEMGCLLS